MESEEFMSIDPFVESLPFSLEDQQFYDFLFSGSLDDFAPKWDDTFGVEFPEDPQFQTQSSALEPTQPSSGAETLNPPVSESRHTQQDVLDAHDLKEQIISIKHDF